MNLIVAVDRHFGIGKNNQLLTYLPLDLNYFKEKTLNKTLVLGRKTLESFKGGKPLPKRRHIVLSHNTSYEMPGIEVVHSLEELFERLETINKEEVFVAGGGIIYSLLLPYCDTLYITMIDQDYEADTFMPDVRSMPEVWRMTWESDEQVENDIHYRWTRYERCK